LSQLTGLPLSQLTAHPTFNGIGGDAHFVLTDAKGLHAATSGCAAKLDVEREKVIHTSQTRIS